MTFRGHKGTDPFSTKTSRNERFAQMSQQELLIEQKKREIQAKLAQKKEVETVKPIAPAVTLSKPFIPVKRENTSTTQSAQQNSARDSSRDGGTRDRDTNRRSHWNRDFDSKWRKDTSKSNTDDASPSNCSKNSLNNVYVNDGSFLDQFKKLAEGKSTIDCLKVKEEKIDSPNHESKSSRNLSLSCDRYRSNRDSKRESSRDSYRDSKTERRGDRDRGRSHTSSQSAPREASIVVKPRAPSPYSPSRVSPDSSPPPPAMPQFTTSVPPPSLFSVQPPNMSHPPPMIVSPPPLIPPGIPPPLMMTSNIPPLPPQVSSNNTLPLMQSLVNVPPPSILTSQPPPSILTGMSVPPPNINNPPPPTLSNPPPQFGFNLPSGPPPPLPAVSNCPVSMQVMPPLVTYSQPPLTEVSPAASPANEMSALTAASSQLARMVAEGGDDIEEMARERNRDDPSMWFLFQKDSGAYKQYRDLVERLRATKINLEQQMSATHVNIGVKRESETQHCDGNQNKKRRSRWGEKADSIEVPSLSMLNTAIVPPVKPLLSKVTRTDSNLLAYAMKSFGTTQLSDEDWKKCEDHYKVHLLYNEMLRKREQLAKLQRAGKHKYEYDSDEEIEGGTWEHRLRSAEMEATERWADELTKQAEGKHHIGDFLPPHELEKFMEKYNARKEGREPDLSDYKEYKLKEDNIGFKMLQKLGWSEGQGLGSDGQGITDPVNKASVRAESHGLGLERPEEVAGHDDEYEAYRKRMMLAYRFRPNPLNNPRRSYY